MALCARLGYPAATSALAWLRVGVLVARKCFFAHQPASTAFRRHDLPSALICHRLSHGTSRTSRTARFRPIEQEPTLCCLIAIRADRCLLARALARRHHNPRIGCAHQIHEHQSKVYPTNVHDIPRVPKPRARKECTPNSRVPHPTCTKGMHSKLKSTLSHRYRIHLHQIHLNQILCTTSLCTTSICTKTARSRIHCTKSDRMRLVPSPPSVGEG